MSILLVLVAMKLLLGAIRRVSWYNYMQIARQFVFGVSSTHCL